MRRHNAYFVTPPSVLVVVSFEICFLMTGMSCCVLIRVVLYRATKTKSHPPGSPGSMERYASRMTLRARLRETALPIFLLVVMPIRLIFSLFFLA